METNIMREVPSCLSSLASIVLKLLGLLQSPEIGVSSILDAALAPPVRFPHSNYMQLAHVNVNATDCLSYVCCKLNQSFVSNHLNS